MISAQTYLQHLQQALPRFAQHPPNPNQQSCILHSPTQPLMIVAGPGSGKTTVLALRALRHVFVDSILPEEIVVTTFTRKAANELRSRLLEWGTALQDHLLQNGSLNAATQAALQNIDINRFVTGTLDSICEDVVTTLRDPGAPVPVVVETFVSNNWLLREGMFPVRAHQNPQLDNYLRNFTFEGDPPRNMGERIDVCRSLADRFIHDFVDMASFAGVPTDAQARVDIQTMFTSYEQFMGANNRLDFARLESQFLASLRNGGYQRFTNAVRVLLVDEYQDTNFLQEEIYFEIIRRTNASLTIVGDDDQSLYRFRGATVELFRDFGARFQAALPTQQPPHRIDLADNYRSTPEIVGFFNSYITNDPGFAPARVQPLKPAINPVLPSNGIPILGMFRPDRGTLADDLTAFLVDVFRGNGRQIPGTQTLLRADSNGGDFGDAVFLGHTVNELGAAWGNNPPPPRLPLLLRQRLAAQGIGVFNPRGQQLRDILVVQQLLGLLLECIDPPPAPGQPGAQESQMLLRAEPQRYFQHWRQAARTLIASNPQPSAPHTLQQFVGSWQARASQTAAAWPNEWPILELCFKLITWIPFLRNDPEGQVHLEAVARCFAEGATFSPYRATILYGQNQHDDRSVHAAVRDLFVPIAERSVDVDEDIMPSVPRNRLTFMTIHQSKGLEYPLVIVDVSSDFKTNHAKQKFKRFPESPSNVTRMEDELAAHSPIGPLRMTRTALERTFEDLIRLYYVAYSRAQSALLLVGLDKCIQYSSNIKHVATFWRADETWAWIGAFAGRRRPGLANRHPLELI